MAKFDVVVVGGGPGGYVAAIYAAQQGLKTALVEKENLGGTCLNWGCIPTKALARNTEVLATVLEADKFGVALDKKSVKGDYAAAQKRSRDVSSQLTRGIAGLLKKNKVELFTGTASLVDAKKVKVEPKGEIIEATNIILATGSRPNMIPGVEVSEKVMTSRQALELTEVPKKMVVIGAGAIGMEFTNIWTTYGAEVTVVEMLPRVLPNEDEAVSAEVEKAFAKRGIKFMVGTKLEKIDQSGKGIKVTVNKDGKATVLECDKMLVSAGIRPNTEGFDKVGIKLNERKYVEIDDSMQTNVKGVYAIGDITGKLALAHVASAQALVAVDAIKGKPVKKLTYYNLPRCTYTVPEVSSVGLTEAQAKEKGYKVKVGKFPMMASGKAISYGETTGFVKIVADEKYGEILGVHMVGPHVTELIDGPAAYIDLEITAEDVARVVHAHPTLSETIMEAAHAVTGHAIHF
ncbi:MAG: dihydrolipoyl dehydrogenase [Bacillota bacterium]